MLGKFAGRQKGIFKNYYTTGSFILKKYQSLVFCDNRDRHIAKSKKSEQFFCDKFEIFIRLFDELFACHFIVFFFFFLLVLWLGICVEVDVDRIDILPPTSLFFFFLPTILSLTFEISARLKLVSVPFSSLVLYIGHLEKSFPESMM